MDKITDSKILYYDLLKQILHLKTTNLRITAKHKVLRYCYTRKIIIFNDIDTTTKLVL